MSEYWRGKRVLLTGHTGFKGSWLSIWLAHMGAEVFGYALEPPTRPNLFELTGLDERVVSTRGDLRDRVALSRALAEARPDVVFHLAALSQVRESYAAPVDAYAINVMGTVHLLDAVRSVDSVRAVVIVTSDKCYENRETPLGYREDAPMGGYDPYSSSKGCAELVTAAYRNSYFHPAKYAEHGVAVASARSGNVIGGGDWAKDRLIPDILRAIDAGQPVRIRYPSAIRPWQHVLEPLKGYLMLAERLVADGPACGEGWNFGPADEDARSVEWIVERVTQAWGGDARWVLDAAPAPHEANVLTLDASKAHARLGWRTRWSLDVALDRTLAWHRAWLAHQDLHDYSIRQIEDYEGALA